MSSLLQFDGKVDRRGVHLEFYLIRPSDNPILASDAICGDSVEETHCDKCGETHPRLYIAIRKPAGMFGCWVVFRYNGTENVPDLSTPIATFKLPRDAKPLSDVDNAIAWHRS